MPGGFGTMDEFFEILTLVQTKTVTDFPIVLFGKSYYRSLMETMEDMVARGAASKEDLSLILFTDDIDEAMNHIKSYVKDNYKVKPTRRFWWLFEKK